MIRIIVLITFLVFFLNACFKGEKQLLDINKALFWKKSKIEIHLNQLNLPKINGETFIMIHGSAKFSNYISTAKAVNLNCISLRVSNSKSIEVYVPNVLPVLSSGYPIENNKKIPLYWVMDQPIERNSLINNLLITIKKECNLFLAESLIDKIKSKDQK
jgi:hypothetical protein